MVIGGGIAGLTAAWELSRFDTQVELIEKADFLGGHAIQYACKATTECRMCGACSVESMLKDVVNANNINIHLATEVETLEKAGSFKVGLKKSARELDAAMLDSSGRGYTAAPAACAAVKGYSLNNAKFYNADGSLNPETTGSADSLTVDAVVVATGFKPFDPKIKSTYRYGELQNVITGFDLERGKRINGQVYRPSDGKVPEKMAFIQCVGSRDERLGNLWCSQVCCPYALRTAHSIKHINPEMDITVFYMDIQNTGNDFPVFYKQLREDMTFVRNIPVDMYLTEDDKIRTRFMSDADGVPMEDIFDLVVLSVGITPGTETPAMAEKLGLSLNADGFIGGVDQLNNTKTSQEGVFVAGTASGPRTIADSMAHAGQSVCEVMNYLGGA